MIGKNPMPLRRNIDIRRVIQKLKVRGSEKQEARSEKVAIGKHMTGEPPNEH